MRKSFSLSDSEATRKLKQSGTRKISASINGRSETLNVTSNSKRGDALPKKASSARRSANNPRRKRPTVTFQLSDADSDGDIPFDLAKRRASTGHYSLARSSKRPFGDISDDSSNEAMNAADNVIDPSSSPGPAVPHAFGQEGKLVDLELLKSNLTLVSNLRSGVNHCLESINADGVEGITSLADQLADFISVTVAMHCANFERAFVETVQSKDQVQKEADLIIHNLLVTLEALHLQMKAKIKNIQELRIRRAQQIEDYLTAFKAARERHAATLAELQAAWEEDKAEQQAKIERVASSKANKAATTKQISLLLGGLK